MASRENTVTGQVGNACLWLLRGLGCGSLPLSPRGGGVPVFSPARDS